MARVLLLSVVALVAAAHAGAASRAALPGCIASQLKVSVETQGVATTAWIGITVRNSGAPCTLSGPAVLTIRQADRVAAVKGNPLTIPVLGSIGHGHSRLVKADWNNWCGHRTRVRLVVRYAGLTRRTRFNVLPLCLYPRHPSKLLPID